MGQKYIRNKTSGFTMIEMLVTLFILAVLAGIAVPVFSSWLPDYRLKKAARDLYSSFQLARLQAIKTHDTCSVVFNAGGEAYSVVSGAKVIKEVDLSRYGSGIGYGCGDATNDIPGSGSPPADMVTYAGDTATYSSKGMSNVLGYVYLSNSDGTSYGVGTPTSAGVIVLRKWNDGSWE